MFRWCWPAVRSPRAADWPASHLDIAPTIAALLGLPLPANSQGGILFDALSIDADTRAALERRLDQQQVLLAEKLPDRAAGMARERQSRAPAALLAALWFIATLLWAPRGASPGRLAAALGAYFLCYFALFRVFGLGYSLSDVVREEYLNAFFLKNAAAAGGGIVVAALLYRGQILRTAVAVVALVGLRVAWVWYDSGLLMRAYMLDLDQAFMAYMDLLEMFAAAVAACLWTAFAAIAVRRRVRQS